MKTPASIGILSPTRSAPCLLALQQLMDACAAAGLNAYEMGRNTVNDPVLGRPELILCLGGDGTMLSVALAASSTGSIIGGINMVPASPLPAHRLKIFLQGPRPQ